MDLNRRAFVAGATALAATARAAVPVPLPERFTPAQMRTDLQLIRRAYALLHPGLTRYLTTAQFDGLVDRAIRWGERERTPAEFYIALARLTAAVRCGHTHANPANQRGLVQRELLGRPDRLPFCTAWIGGRLAVTDPMASGLAPGTVIAAVDGVPARQLLQAMLPLARADGHNDAKRVAQLELHRGDRFAAFDIFRPLLFGRAKDGEVRLTLAGGQNAVLPALAEGTRGAQPADDPQYGWRFVMGKDRVGVLTMPDWSLYQSKWDWRRFLYDTADALISAGARGLIVDLRENEGGIDCGDVLLARLIDRPVEEAGTRKLVRFRETPLDLRPALDTWDQSFQTLGANAVPVADRPGYYDLGEAELRRIEPTGKRFTGKVAVLVSATCSSATFGFAQLVRQCGAATLIGTPTGGNRRGINGGRYFFVRLPETRFEVDLPLVGYFPATPQPDAGIVPDLIVPPSVTALRAGRDDTMIAARRHVLG